MKKDYKHDMNLFGELMTCGHNIYSFELAPDFSLKKSNCKEKAFYRELLGLDEKTTALLTELAANKRPIVMANKTEFVFIADFSYAENGDVESVFIIGPILLKDLSFDEITASFAKDKLSPDCKKQLYALVSDLPVLSVVRFYNYGIMQHFCLTGEKIAISDFQYPIEIKQNFTSRPPARRDLRSIWTMEQNLLRLVEEGNPDYDKLAYKLVNSVNLYQLGRNKPLRNLKNLVITFTSLCTRAAIKGGVTPEIAYSLSGSYIESIEKCNSIPEAADISENMQQDFIQRVRKAKAADTLPQIENVKHRIENAYAENLSPKELAKECGYSESHLARLFKQKTGLTISEYATQVKIEHAKTELRSGGKSVQDVCAELGFNSQSYFGKLFKAYTTMTPTEFRRKQGQLK